MTSRRSAPWLALLASACVTGPPGPPPSPAIEERPGLARVEPVRPKLAVAVAADDPITRGELPWWHGLRNGIYRAGGRLVVYGVGESSAHHHIAEGLLTAKVNARLGVRKAAERVLFNGALPEPQLQDLFITREQRILALHGIFIPHDAVPPQNVATLSPPDLLLLEGRRRIGRHMYEGERHLWLECDVEGPVANPDWGRTQASARP